MKLYIVYQDSTEVFYTLDEEKASKYADNPENCDATFSDGEFDYGSLHVNSVELDVEDPISISEYTVEHNLGKSTV